MARTGPKRRRLSRAEWHAEQEMSMSIAKAESAVLDSAARREMNAAKQEKANADAAALLAKEKRKALEAVEQANAAMREAKRLQAAATAKYDQAEALLAQYGLADVPPQPAPPHRATERRAPQPPCSRMGGLFNEQPAAAGCDGRSPMGCKA